MIGRGLLVMAVMAAPAAAAPALTIDDIRARDPKADIRELRAGERIVLWKVDPDVPTMFGHGGRASLFVADGAGWRHVGDVDSMTQTSDVGVVTVTADGIAILVEEIPSNNWSSARAYAIALVGEKIATAETNGLVNRVDVAGKPPELRLTRWIDPANTYPDEPQYVTRWSVRRSARGLEAREESLTPWLDTLAAFCSGVHPELAEAAVLPGGTGCPHGMHEIRLRRVSRTEVHARLPMCGDDGSLDGTVVLRRRTGGWRVAAIRGCR